MRREDQQKQLEQQQAAARTVASLYRNTFKHTPQGAAVFADLKGQFGGDITHQLEHLQHTNVGARRVLDYIQFMIDYEEPSDGGT